MLFKTLITTTFISVLMSYTIFANDFSRIPSSTSVEMAHQFKADRFEVTLQHYLSLPIGEYAFKNPMDFYLQGLARIIANEKVDEVENVILSPATKVYALPGTEFHGTGPICRRNGDYDFMLTGLIALTYEAKKRNNLSKPAMDKIIYELLSQRGVKHHTKFHLQGCGTWKETENHILMTEGARYLTNQLLHNENPNLVEYDNSKNGFDEWMLEHLKQFLIHDFDEYNSRPYQSYTVRALSNLANYPENEKVRTAASMVLDYLSVKYAISSNNLRRQAPISRQKKYSKKDILTTGDHETGRMFMAAGNSDGLYLKENHKGTLAYNEGLALSFLTGLSEKYNVPDLILDMLIDRKNMDYFQVLSHKGVEIYSGDEHYLLSSGGHYIDFMHLIDYANMDSWAFPTTVIPSQGEFTRRNLIRIEGHLQPAQRNNTCVYKNFACGHNVQLPDNLDPSCTISKKNWTFIDYTKKECSQKYNFFAAIYREKMPWFYRLKGHNFGAFEVYSPKSSSDTFANFVNTVLRNNEKTNFSTTKTNQYTTYSGDRIKFLFESKNTRTWPIAEINGQATERSFKRWPLASGDVIKTREPGYMEIRNLNSNKKMILDFRDTLNPKRLELDL